MAGKDLSQLRYSLLAPCLYILAPWIERAGIWRTPKVGYRARDHLQRLVLSAPLREGGEEGFGVRGEGLAEEFVPGRRLDEGARVHDRGPARDPRRGRP